MNATTSGSVTGDQIPKGSGSTFQGVTDISYYNPSTTTRTTIKKWKRVSGAWQLDTSFTPNPQTTTEVPSGDVHPVTFDCGLGNLYIEGTVKGRVTIAAQNNLILTGDLSIASTSNGNTAIGPDMVGLVAANSVVVYHPVSRGSASAEALTTTTREPDEPEDGLSDYEFGGAEREQWIQQQHDPVHVDHDEDVRQHLHQHQLPRSYHLERRSLDLCLDPDTGA